MLTSQDSRSRWRRCELLRLDVSATHDAVDVLVIVRGLIRRLALSLGESLLSLHRGPGVNTGNPAGTSPFAIQAA